MFAPTFSQARCYYCCLPFSLQQGNESHWIFINLFFVVWWHAPMQHYMKYICFYLLLVIKQSSASSNLVVSYGACSCCSRHKRVLFPYFCSPITSWLVVRYRWSACCTQGTHHWYTYSFFNNIPQKSKCNQLRLAKDIIFQSYEIFKVGQYHLKIWGKGQTWGLLTFALSILTWQVEDPPVSFCLICLSNLRHTLMGFM